MSILQRTTARIGHMGGAYARLLSKTYVHPRHFGTKVLFPTCCEDDFEPKLRLGFRYSPYSVDFADITEENLRDKEYNLFVPLTLEDIEYLAPYRHLLKDNPLPIPSWESIQICDDKETFNNTLPEMGYAEWIPKVDSSLKPPYILKKKVDYWGANTYLVDTDEKVELYQDKISSPEYFMQQVIPGTKEYATHFIIKNKQVVCWLNVEYTFENELPIKGKSPILYKKFVDCPYLDEFTDMLNGIGFEGLCCFNYKVWHNQPYMIEINPRFGNSLMPFFFSFVPDIMETVR